MFFRQYLKIFLILILFFFSLTYFFVPVYELLCNKFGWGLNFDLIYLDKFLIKSNDNFIETISLDDSLYIK